LILKGLVYQTSRLAASVGVSVTMPTARDTRVRVIDFLGDFNDNDIEVQRLRDFTITNDTWAVSPFLAFLATPTERFFFQAFLQFDIPAGRSKIFYTELPLKNTEPGELTFNTLVTTADIREQSLMHLDLGTGFWLIRRPDEDRWLTGLAPTLELHYTHTLNNA